MLIKESARSTSRNNSATKKTTAPKRTSASERAEAQAEVRQITKQRNATKELEEKTAARKAAEKARDDYFNTRVDEYDFLADKSISKKAEVTYKALCATAEKAKEEESQARKKLWSAKYDTMSAAQLQEALVGIEDELEKSYATGSLMNAREKRFWKDICRKAISEDRNDLPGGGIHGGHTHHSFAAQ